MSERIWVVVIGTPTVMELEHCIVYRVIFQLDQTPGDAKVQAYGSHCLAPLSGTSQWECGGIGPLGIVYRLNF